MSVPQGVFPHLHNPTQTHTYIQDLSRWPWKVLLITVLLASITAAQKWPLDLSLSPGFTRLHPFTRTPTRSQTMWRIYFYLISLWVSLCLIIPAAPTPRLWVAHVDHTNQHWNVCVFLRWCVHAGVLLSLITPRWILITVWWDTEHQSQSSDALVANHFNEYILFWPFCELFFVFHITYPFLHHSLSVLALFCIHTLPFNSLHLSSFSPSAKTRYYTSKVELLCLYSELSQVHSAEWTHHNESRRLEMSSSNPGSISAVLPLPITPDTAGNYTCSLQLKNGQVIRAVQTVSLPLKGGSSCTANVPFFSSSDQGYHIICKEILADFLSTWWA